MNSVVFGVYFFPKQFTVGVLVLDSILSMSALFGCHVRPFGISVLSILYICLQAWVVVFALLELLSFGFSTFVFKLGLSSSPFSDLSPSISLHSGLGSDVRLFRNSVLAILYMCLPAWAYTSALCSALPSQYFSFFITHVRPFRISVFLILYIILQLG